MGGAFSKDTYKRAWTKLHVEPVNLNTRILITGGNEGLGFETALQLSKMGASIIIASSNYQKSVIAVEKLKNLSKNSNITCEFLDLSSFQSVREFCETFIKRYDRLDTLICNSGTSVCKFELTEDNYERTLQVNYLSHAMLTLNLMPILKKTKGSRIIFVTSKAYSIFPLTIPADLYPNPSKHHYYISYSHTKLMQLLLALKLSQLLSQQDPKVIAIYPGFTKTRLGFNNWDHYTGLRKLLVNLISFILFKICARTTEQGAINIVFGVISEKIVSGGYYNSCNIEDVKGQANDMELIEKNWEYTLDILNINENSIDI